QIKWLGIPTDPFIRTGFQRAAANPARRRMGRLTRAVPPARGLGELLLNSRRKPILAALPEGRKAESGEAEEHHRPGRQFGDGLGAAHGLSGRRRLSWIIRAGERRQKDEVMNERARILVGRGDTCCTAWRIGSSGRFTSAQRQRQTDGIEENRPHTLPASEKPRSPNEFPTRISVFRTEN